MRYRCANRFGRTGSRRNIPAAPSSDVPPSRPHAERPMGRSRPARRQTRYERGALCIPTAEPARSMDAREHPREGSISPWNVCRGRIRDRRTTAIGRSDAVDRAMASMGNGPSPAAEFCDPRGGRPIVRRWIRGTSPGTAAGTGDGRSTDAGLSVARVVSINPIRGQLAVDQVAQKGRGILGTALERQSTQRRFLIARQTEVEQRRRVTRPSINSLSRFRLRKLCADTPHESSETDPRPVKNALAK